MAERFEIQVLKYGGGGGTVTICCLIALGVLEKPDRIVMADTGREMPTTWAYLAKYVAPLLAPLGLRVEVAPRSLATVDLYSKKSGTLLIPAFTATGKFSAWCSGEWKTAVGRRYLRDSGVESATEWIGYGTDEPKRWAGKPMEDGPWRFRFPLVELGLVEGDYHKIQQKAGIFEPPKKSRCAICSNQTQAEWREVRAIPDLWEEVCLLDEQLREDDAEHAIYLHFSRVPLREADLDADDGREPSRQCSLGMCFV